jgi:DNA end-binding protein Ku
MSSLAYADEVVDPSEISELQGINGVDVSAKEIAMAESLVDSLTADFEPAKYHDEYREQVMALIQMKADGQEFEVPEAATEKPKVIDIMAALEASVAAAKNARASHPTGAASKAKAKSAKATSKSAAAPRSKKPTAKSA